MSKSTNKKNQEKKSDSKKITLFFKKGIVEVNVKTEPKKEISGLNPLDIHTFKSTFDSSQKKFELAYKNDGLKNVAFTRSVNFSKTNLLNWLNDDALKDAIDIKIEFVVYDDNFAKTIAKASGINISEIPVNKLSAALIAYDDNGVLANNFGAFNLGGLDPMP